MIEILLGTSSADKLRELRAMTAGEAFAWLGLRELPPILEPLEDGDTFEANARKKALYYAAASGRVTLADDSGLEVDCLAGQPGVHSAYYAGTPRDDAANNRKLVAAVRGIEASRRTARYHCALVLARPNQVLHVTHGRFTGLIIDTPRGENGFGYDPHFLVPELGLTAAELAPAEKNSRSHRGQALRAMLAWLRTHPPRP